MRSSSSLFSRLLVLGASFGPLAGCPANSGTDTDTDATGGTTGATTGATTGGPTTTDATTQPTSEPTTTGTTAPDTTTGDTTGDTTVDPGDTTTGDTTTDGVDPACACIDPGPIGSASFTCASSCGSLLPDCVPVEGDTDTEGDEGACELTIDEAKLDCAIDLLIAGEGAVKYSYSSDMGFSEYGGFIKLLPDRKGVARTWSREDLGLEDSDAGLVTLKPASYFEGCKAEPTLAGKYGCLTDWSDDEPDALCDAAGSGTDF